jgi:O-antigen/teichoic acid export membrane protein
MISKLKQLKNHQGFIKYFKNTSWLFSEKIFRMFISLFIGIFVARYLGPNQFGVLNYVISFVGLFGIIATLGINNIVVKHLVNNKNLKNTILGTAFSIRLLGAMLLIFILTIFMYISNNSSLINTYIYILAFSTVILSFNVIDLFFQSRIKSKFVANSNLFAMILTSAIKVYLIIIKAPLIAFITVILLDSFILASGLIYFYLKTNNNILKWSFNMKLAKQILQESWPLVLAGLAVSIYLKVDQIMLMEMMGTEAVGHYAAAVRISEAWYFIPIVISSSLFPAIINAKKNDNKLYFKRLKQLLSFLVWFAIFIAIPMTFFSKNLIDTLYGNAYYQAGPVLMLHIWGAVFIFLGEASSRWFISENLQRYLFYRTLMGAILNILLNYFLINHYGIYGAALSTIISQFFSVYIFNLFNKKTLPIFKLQTFAFFAPYIYIEKYLLRLTKDKL